MNESHKSEHKDFPIREDKIHKIEVHVAGLCVREHKEGWKLLAAHRTDSRYLFPGKWECGGGAVQSGEGFEAALKRQMFEEFGIEVHPWFVAEWYEIHIPTPQKIIPGIRFVCRTGKGKITLNKREFSSCKWIDLPLNSRLDWIDGIEHAIKLATQRILQNETLADFEQDW